MRLFAACLLLSLPLRGEIVDRLAISVGKHVVTQLQLDEELRITAMLNHKPVLRTLDERRAAADRMVQQLLIQNEMELSRYPLPGEKEVDRYFQQVEEAGGGAADFAKTLDSFHLTAATLREHLLLQLTELSFLEYRFKPDAAVSDSDIEAAYARQAASWKQSHSGTPPTLEASRDVLRALLVEERTDSALNTWLAESRTQSNIVYFDKSLE